MVQRLIPSIRPKLWLAPWQNIDWSLLILVVGLTIFGSIMIRSTELHQGLSQWGEHLLFGSCGLTIAMMIARWRYDALIQWHWVIYGLTNLSLVAVMAIGITAKGAQRWINLGFFNLQPSEFAKIGLIITLAALLHQKPASTLSAVFRILAVAAVPWALVFLQPNLGTSLILAAITLGMLYWGNANPGWLVLMLSPLISAILFSFLFKVWIFWALGMGIIAWLTLPWRNIAAVGAVALNFLVGKLAGVLWGILKDYQKNRLIMFLDPEKDPLGGGYHLIQSRIAIGSGELWGRGLNQGTQTQLNFVPEQHNDFIFSAIGEELGFIGSICVLVIFWLICLRLVVIACSAKDNFGSLMAIGVLTMIAFQVVVNISMNVGIGPVTGIPLPWLSYGGSSLLANFIAIGLVESVANFRPRKRF